MLTLSTLTARIHACATAVAAAPTPAATVSACAVAKLTARDVTRYTEDHEGHCRLMDGDLADLGHATARLHDVLTARRAEATFHAAGFALEDAAPPVRRLVARLQRLCEANPCFEDT